MSEEDKELFHASEGSPRDQKDRIRKAKAICSKCPVSLECLLYALKTKDEYAILGGTTPEERRI